MSARTVSRSLLASCLLTGMAAVAFAATSQWQFTPTPSPGNQSQLRGVEAAAPDDAWSVGWLETTVGGSTEPHSLALHWDGTDWTQVPTPNPSLYSGAGGTKVYLYDVEALSADDAWAAGTYQAAHKVDGFPGFQAFTIHWDGTSWTQVPAPQTPVGGTGG